MSFKQRLDDTALLLRESRKAQVIAICIFAALAFLIVGGSSNPHRVKSAKNQSDQIDVDNTTGARAAQEAFQDYNSAIITESKILKKKSEDLQKQIVELEKKREEDQQRVAEIMKMLIQRVNEKGAAGGVAGPGDQGPIVYTDDDTTLDPESDSLESFGEVNDDQVIPPPQPEAPKHAYISPADSVRVKLLAGVKAPTDGTPYPVLFKMMGHVRGPDGSALPLGEARIVAAAQGSLSDSRVLFRLTTLSMRFPNGERKNVEVDGWIVGEDGIRGMEGILTDPIGKYIGGGLVAGTVAGLGQGVSQAQTTTSVQNGNAFSFVDGDVGSYAVGRGIQGAGNEWSGILRERLRELTPVVTVYSGREATAVFAQPVQIDGLYDLLTVSETDIYGSLD